MRAKWLALFAIVILCFPSLGSGQTFVYPVGNPNEMPTDAFPNRNGYLLTQEYVGDQNHTGVDLCTLDENGKCVAGGEVRSIGVGTVANAHTCLSPSGACGATGDQTFGNAILIRHDLPGGPFYSLYAHMLDGSIELIVGVQVTPGTPIGRVGSTGDSTAPHLHFAIKLENLFRCGYIRKEPCLSTDSFSNPSVPTYLRPF